METEKKYRRKEEYYRILMSTVVDVDKVYKCDKFQFMCATMETLGKSENFIEIISVDYDKRVLANDPRATTVDVNIVVATHAPYTTTEIGAVFNDINRLAFGGQCLLPCVMKIKRGRRRLSSCNATTLKAYCVALKGVKGMLTFPNAESKRYFMALVKSACASMPFRVMAYSLTHNAVYMTVCNFDGHKRSIASIMETIIDSYKAYFNKQFGKNIKNMFNGKSIVTAIDPTQIFNNIAQVNQQPILAGVPQNEVMEFSSQTVASNPNKVSLVAMFINTNLAKESKKCVFISNEKVVEHMISASRDASNSVVIAGRKPDDEPLYTLHFEEAMYNHQIFDSNYMTAQELALVALDMREVHGYELDEIFNHSFNTHHAIEKVMAEIVYIQALHKQMNARAIKRSLGTITVSNGVLVSAIALINDRKGYSFEYIATHLGYSAEHPLLKNMVIDEVAVAYNITPISAKMKLNLL